MMSAIGDPQAATPAWLTQVLRADGCLPQGHVTGIDVTLETSYTSTIARLALTYSDETPPAAPAHLFLKLARLDAAQSVVGGRQRRREVLFHNQIAAMMPDPPLVHCYHAAYDEQSGAAHLLFDDLSATHAAGQISPPPPLPQCLRAMDALAEFHAFWWDHPRLGDIDPLPDAASVAEHVENTRRHFERFVDVLGSRLSPAQHRVYDRTLDALPRLWQRVTQGTGLTLIHGDMNFSNVLLPREPDRALIIDWQLWGISFAAEDLAHMIALFWDPADRRRLERDLLQRYHQELVRHGVKNDSWADCWHDYRLAVLLRVLFMPMWFWSSGAPESSWLGSLGRAMQAVEDLKCVELLS